MIVYVANENKIKKGDTPRTKRKVKCKKFVHFNKNQKRINEVEYYILHLKNKTMFL